MARSLKSGLDYFPLDVDFFSDEKIIVVTGKFGLVAEVVAMHLLCCIYRKGYFAQWGEPLKFKLLRDLPGMDADTLEAIVAELVRWGFFDEALFRNEGVLTSEGIQKRYFEAVRRCKPSASLPHLLTVAPTAKVSAAKTTQNVAETPHNSAETRERKENKIKENKTKENQTTTERKENTVADVVVVDAGKFSENNFLSRYLGSITPEQEAAVEKSFGTDMATFRRLAEAVVAEWTVTGKTHTDYADARSHLLHHIRRKLAAQRQEQQQQSQQSQQRGSTLERARDDYRARRQAEREAEEERRRQYQAELEATGMSGWEAFCRQRGLDPSHTSAADLAAHSA